MRRIAVVVALLLLGAGLLAGTPAGAATPSTDKRVTIVFDKNWRNQFQSRVIWRVEQRRGDRWRIVDRADWRAGSGLADRYGKNACVRNHGWLPDGVYSFVQYDHYDGTYINGRAFRLQDRRCHNGTIRQSLFIHSEQTVQNTQCPDVANDQYCRWEYPRINEYRSNGCIKMSPWDLRQLTERFHRHFRSGVRHSTGVARVVVR